MFRKLEKNPADTKSVKNTESKNKREKKPIPFKYGFVKLSLYTVQLQWFFE